MAQNIYDDPDFFAGYGQLKRSQHGLNGASEWPSLQALLPNLDGLRVTDLGCGYGWFCRYSRTQGAAQVTGYDLSERMLDRAKALTSDPAIGYVRADLETLVLEPGSADFIYSSLAFHYIADLGRLLTTLRSALVPGGRLLFSTEHPIYMAPTYPEWTTHSEGHRIWPLDRYLVEGPRITNWISEGVVKHHRTLGTTLNLLIQHGFTLAHIEEWKPTESQIEAHPEMAEELDRPMFLIIAAGLPI
jgi:SAM-dependent methyltransferase